MSEKTVLVYSSDGQRLTNTLPCMARKLLNSKKARVVKKTPFSIQLLYKSKMYGASDEFLSEEN